jgi:hypothetical protein
MANATLAQIREGLRVKLAAAFAATAQVSGYQLDDPAIPTIQVMGPDAVEYDELMSRGLDRWTIVIQAFAGSWEQRAAQEVLDQWLAPTGSTSVKAAVESDITLGGIVASARVARSSGYRVYDLPNRGRTLGAEFFVDVVAGK